MPRKTRPSSHGPDSSPAQPATGPTPTPPPPTSPTISTVRRDPTTGNLLLATSDPRPTFVSTKPVVNTINLTNPRYAVGFVYASEWERCEPVTDYTLLPRTLHHTRLFTPPLRPDLPRLQWQAISNPWFLADGVAIVRISPVSCDDPAVNNATSCTLAEWLSVPEALAPRDPSPTTPFTPVSYDYDQVFLRLLAAFVTGISANDNSSIYGRGDRAHPNNPERARETQTNRDRQISYYIEVAADVTEAALAHLASRKNPSCPPPTPTPNPKSPPTN